ncbi:MAG TPA: GNAT family N-acetyltransferase [Phenylobacterium sp.]|jgi:GNAT superfamily N-acetyltransferase|uniref:GNAT family N-acetyltransferase n=1 Tax=Phenylobacterium sp. TaxID=1871053 RepID=UPI002D2C499F|nr:GNAT family N-acetyltransferase [Phenylobacterium sp.]HZZ69837.1 GNAT family N-acetyltransferase [Phenylobacterium sp.]
MSSLTVSRATEAEAPACLALLPQAHQMPAEFLIAKQDGRLAGAAALMWRSWATPSGFPVSVQVLAEHRRQGVGRRLLGDAVAWASGEADGLWSLEPQALEGPAAAFLDACGFRLARRQRHFEADVKALRDNVAPALARLRRHGRIPADARVVPLAEAPLEEVGWLVSAQFGGGPFRALQNLRRRVTQRGISTGDLSQVVLHGDKVVGVILARLDHGVAVIDGRIVAPGARGDWAGALQLDAVLGHGPRFGLKTFRFHCDDDVRDTLSLARRSNARELAQKGLFYYALSAA